MIANPPQPSSKALLECLSIFAGLLFAAFITALCDYKKEKQILLLHDEINNAIVTVYRGSFGNTTDIPVRELVVGDIVDIKQGDRVPADCLLVEEMNITVDQSLYFKDKDGSGDTLKVAKEPSEYYGPDSFDNFGLPLPDNHKSHPDPFLFSDTKVMTGTGKALVCCVGKNTLLATTRKPEDLVVEEQKTFLETRLETAADQISKFAKLAAALIIVTRLIFIFFSSILSEDSMTLNKLM